MRPCLYECHPAFHGQFGGEGIGVAQVMLLFKGSDASGAVQVSGDDRDRKLPSLR